MGKKAKQGLNLLLKIALAVGLITWFIHKGLLNLQSVSNLLSPWPALVLLLAAFFQVYFNNLRWFFLLRAHLLPISIRSTLALSFIGLFFNYAMPGGVGGDVIKGYYLLQDYPEHKTAGIVSIFMDRMIGFSVMIFTAALALLMQWQRVQSSAEFKTLALAVWLLSFGFVAFYVLALSKTLHASLWRKKIFLKMPLGHHIEKIYLLTHSYRSNLKTLQLSFLLSFVSQFFLIGAVAFVGFWLGYEHLSFGDYAFIVPIGTVVMALPISPAGIGVGQAAFYFLFNLYLGHVTTLGPTAATALQISQFVWGLSGAFFYLRRKNHAN
jgi:uncharacterized protein (TIRG00374 family)